MRQLQLVNLLLVLLALQQAHAIFFKDFGKLFPKLPKLPKLKLDFESTEEGEASDEDVLKVLKDGSDKWMKDAFQKPKKPFKNLFDLWGDKSEEKEAFIDAKKDYYDDKKDIFADKKELYAEKKDEIDDKIKAFFTDKKLVKELFTEMKDKFDEKDAYIKEKLDEKFDAKDDCNCDDKKKLVVVDHDDPCSDEKDGIRYFT